MTLDGTGSSDPDGDPLTFVWKEGATVIGRAAVLSVSLGLGTHTFTLTVDDGRRKTSSNDVTIVVRDTTPPDVILPLPVIVEAVDPRGAAVEYSVRAIDAVSGTVTVACTPTSGSWFAIGVTQVLCSSVDAAGNAITSTFPVVVRDSTAPTIQFVTPSPDVRLFGPTVDVVLQARDVVGVATVAVNGVAAALAVGTPQAGTWRATVPVPIFIAAGTVVRFDAQAVDTMGNAGAGVLVVDNDGIPASMDRGRTTGADQSGRYSNDFNNGVTTGTLARNGWITTLSNGPIAGGVRVAISGAGAIATIGACVGAIKEVRLDGVGETADVTCDPITGTITVKAVSALPRIELREQLANGMWQQFNLRTGQSMSVGSPAHASQDNADSIEVQLLRADHIGNEMVVGSYSMAPGARVDVSIVRGMRGRADQFRFNLLDGRASVTVGRTTRTLKVRHPATMTMEER